MAEEEDSFFRADTRKISKKELLSLASESKIKFKTKFHKSRKTISSGKSLREQAKALLEKHSDDPSARFRFTKSCFITVHKLTRSPRSSSISSSSSSSSSSAPAAA
jgi:GTP cyclohydrolase FolE2